MCLVVKGVIIYISSILTKRVNLPGRRRVLSKQHSFGACLHSLQPIQAARSLLRQHAWHSLTWCHAG